MPLPSVSIVIPTRNRAAVLAQCLEALAPAIRGIGPCEIIVADDCSTDDTPAVVSEFARRCAVPVNLVRQPRPLGASAGRNRALDESRGEILVFLDDDSIVRENGLEQLVRGLKESSSPVVFGGMRVTLEGPLLGKHREEIASYLCEVSSPANGFIGRPVPLAGNMATYRWVFERARFDETVRPPVEEADWLYRAGVEAAFIPEAWAWHRKTGEEARLKRLLGVAWKRGSEGGWWFRERAQIPAGERRTMALRSLKTFCRALGHAVTKRCWGGAVVGLGELARALALVGLINRGSRRAESWQ